MLHYDKRIESLTVIMKTLDKEIIWKILCVSENKTVVILSIFHIKRNICVITVFSNALSFYYQYYF